MIDGGLRAVGVEDLQAKPARVQPGLDLLQRGGGRSRQDRRRRLVPVYRRADEVVRAVVADVEDDARDRVAEANEVSGPRLVILRPDRGGYGDDDGEYLRVRRQTRWHSWVRWTPFSGQVFVTAKVESGVMIQATLG